MYVKELIGAHTNLFSEAHLEETKNNNNIFIYFQIVYLSFVIIINSLIN